jgi:hypothetical protein
MPDGGAPLSLKMFKWYEIALVGVVQFTPEEG